MKLLECVPNFSEGRDPVKIEAIAAAIRSVPGARLLHVDTSPAAHRTVMTFAGEPEAVLEAAFHSVRQAAALIDMTKQEGVHPRIGATDVCPLVPLSGISMEEAVSYSKVLAGRIGSELNIPVYLYEYSASAEHRRALPDIRKGQYEGFAAKMATPGWLPDYGPKVFAEESGATVLGARDVLVAFNISLDTDDVKKASFIARRVRESGFYQVKDDVQVHVPGLLPRTRAIGWYMADYGQAQVSLNLLDYRVCSPLKAFEACANIAAEIGVSIAGSEVIGLIPEECLLEAGSFSLLRKGMNMAMDKQLLIHEAIGYLGLNRLRPFDPQEKILEYALFRAGLLAGDPRA